jgi:serine O-acetyltransferase
MTTFAETRQRLRQDRERLRPVLDRDPARRGGWLFFDPSYRAVFLHRWSRYFFCRGNRVLARFLWQFNLSLTGADLSPISDLGGGLVLVEPLACVLVGSAGRNLTIRAHASFGGGMSRDDIGAGPGLPVFGDDVEIDFGAVILGPVRIGDGTYIGPRCVVRNDVDSASVVSPIPPRIRRIAEKAPGPVPAHA